MRAGGPLGDLFLGDDPADRDNRFALCAGLTGAGLLAIVNGFAAVELILGARHPNRVMIVIGILVGSVSSAFFTWRALRLLRMSVPRADR